MKPDSAAASAPPQQDGAPPQIAAAAAASGGAGAAIAQSSAAEAAFDGARAEGLQFSRRRRAGTAQLDADCVRESVLLRICAAEAQHSHIVYTVCIRFSV